MSALAVKGSTAPCAVTATGWVAIEHVEGS
jgi:hypothetical protein